MNNFDRWTSVFKVMRAKGSVAGGLGDSSVLQALGPEF